MTLGIGIGREISIHAPRVGSDYGTRTQKSGCLEFQSTLPVWGATGQTGREPQNNHISIHAPRVGSDLSAFASSDL